VSRSDFAFADLAKPLQKGDGFTFVIWEEIWQFSSVLRERDGNACGILVSS